MIDISGQSALVTGAGRGFGAAIAQALARAGVRVTLAARSEAQLLEVRDQIVNEGGTAQVAAVDLTDSVEAERAFRIHEEAFGSPDILVNCAGISRPFGPIGEIDSTEWWRAMELHVHTPLTLMNLALPAMRARKSGCIINVSSLAAKMVLPTQSAYSVSKNTLFRLTEHVAAENSDNGVVAFAVHPGFVFTELARQDVETEEARRWSPEFVSLLEGLRESGGGMEGLDYCGDRCVALARHEHDELTGTFLNFDVNRDESDFDSIPTH